MKLDKDFLKKLIVEVLQEFKMPDFELKIDEPEEEVQWEYKPDHKKSQQILKSKMSERQGRE